MGVFILILCFLSRAELPGEHSLFIKALNCVQSRDTPQAPARRLLPTLSALECTHPVANTQGYLWPPKHQLLGAAGIPVSQPRTGWHGQQGARDVQRATLCSLLYKRRQCRRVASSSLWLPFLLFFGPSTMSSDSSATHPACLRKPHGKHTDPGVTGHISLCPTFLSLYLSLGIYVSIAIRLHYLPP